MSDRHVMLVYCDGAYFAGNAAASVRVGGETLHFKGKAILDAALADLASRHGLGTATDVVLGGCSAGGIAVFAHVDYVSRALETLSPSARVAGFADSGFYADVPYYTTQKQFPFHAQNASATLSPECLGANAARPWACLVAAVNAKYVRTPLFAWQSKVTVANGRRFLAFLERGSSW